MSLQLFTDAFIEAALWSSIYEHDDCDACIEGQCNPHCDDGEHELSDNTRETLEALAAEFYSAYKHYFHIGNCPKCTHTPAGLAGHDFWLTSQGHGAGFWDGDWNEPVATILTDAARGRIGELHFHVGDDGKLHL